MPDYRVKPGIHIVGTNIAAAVTQAVIAPAAKADLGVRSESQRVKLSKSLTDGQRRLLAVHLLQMEVMSGGFEQYFRYSAGSWYAEAVEALAHLGATKHLSAVTIALSAFGKSAPPKDVDRRVKALDSLDAKSLRTLERADNRFYAAYKGVEELAMRCIGMMMANPEAFFRVKR